MIDVINQVRAYALWAKEHGIKSIAVWPMNKSGYTVEARHALVVALHIDDAPTKTGHWIPSWPYDATGKARTKVINHVTPQLEKAGYSFPEVDPADYKWKGVE